MGNSIRRMRFLAFALGATIAISSYGKTIKLPVVNTITQDQVDAFDAARKKSLENGERIQQIMDFATEHDKYCQENCTSKGLVCRAGVDACFVPDPNSVPEHGRCSEASQCMEISGQKVTCDSDTHTCEVDQEEDVYNSCMRSQDVINAKSQCESDASSAENSCNQNSNQNQGLLGQITSGASQISQQLGAMAAASVNVACTKIGQLAAVANGALSTYQQQCSGAMSSCKNSCQGAIDKMTACLRANKTKDGSAIEQDSINGYVQDFQAKLQTCNGYQQQANQAQQGLQQTVASLANANNCKQATAGDTYCKAHPTDSACTGKNLAQSCDNPDFAATSVPCICMKNPQDPKCGAASSAGGIASALPSGTLVDQGKDSGAPDVSSLLGEGNDISPVAGGQGRGEELSGKKGGAGGNGYGGTGGGNGAPGGNGGKPAKEKTLASILAGFFGGGSGGDSGSGSNNANGGTLGSGRGAGSPDLRKFLPGGAFDPRRGPASANGIAQGNKNLFQLVKDAYNRQARSLRD